jgi:NADPH:quinone reductase
MRTWQVLRPGVPDDVMRLADVPDIAPGRGQVVLDIEAASIGFPDLLQILGRYQTQPGFPFTPGREFAGVVSAVGPGVRGIGTGERVLTLAGGGLAEQAAVPAAGCLPIPAAMTAVQAAALLVNYGTAVIALEDRARLRAGETLLVTAAAGGVGSAAVQLGKVLGARVIGLAGGPHKVKTVLELGAHLAVDYDEADVVAVLRSATEGRGVDVCFEAVGGRVFDAAARVMAWGGRLLVVGFASGHIPAAATNHLLLKGYGVLGVNSEAAIARDRAELRRIWDRLTGLFGSGDIDPLVRRTLPLDEAPKAFAELAARNSVGKLVVVP